MNKYTIKAQPRTSFGHANSKLRRQGIVPATVFGKGVDSVSIQLSQTEFQKVYGQAGETSVIWISVEGESKERPTLVKSTSKSPVKGQIEHVDFHQVNLKEKVSANVPVEITGESDLVKSGAAVLDQHLYEIEVEALPTEIPESILVDITTLKEIGDHIKVSDLKVSKEVEIITDIEALVVAISEPQAEEEPLTPVVEAEVVGEEKKEAEASSEPAKTE